MSSARVFWLELAADHGFGLFSFALDSAPWCLLHPSLDMAAEVTSVAKLDQVEGRDRRRTVVIYKTSAEAPTGATPDNAIPKEKLASHKNLMYSEREAELIEDLCRFLIEKQPSYVAFQARYSGLRSLYSF